MKRGWILLLSLFAVYSFSGVANASLWDRGGGLIYDDTLDITWLQDANYAETAMNWGAANIWAEGLDYQGYSDWRLVSMDVNKDGTVVDSTVDELTARDNEYGYMFYQNLAGKFGDDLTGDQTVGGVTLKNIQPDVYWSGTEYGTDTAWSFGFGNGSSGFIFKGGDHHAWAVRTGDVPVPGAVLLFASGLISLAGFRRKFRKR